MGRPAGWMKDVDGAVADEVAGARRRCGGRCERAFWREIAKGLTSEDAAVAVGVSQGGWARRWFREGGGMPSI